MDLGTILDVFFGMMVVPCVALLVYGGWLSWWEWACSEQDKRASGPQSVASADSREAAMPARPSGALLGNRQSTRGAA